MSNKHIYGIQGGFFPVYWELFDDDNLNYDDVFFFHYLASVFPILKQEQIIDGKIYKRLADDFIKAKFDVSSPTIIKWFKNLEENGYIKIWKPDNKIKGPRYYTILLDIDEAVKSGYYGLKDSKNDSLNNPLNDSLNDRLKNSETNNSNIKIDIKEEDNFLQKMPWEISNNNSNNNEDKPHYRNIEEFINNNPHQEILEKWYRFIGKKSKIELEELIDKYDNICTQCNHDNYDIRLAIENAYLGHYYNWIKPSAQQTNPQLHVYTDMFE